MKRGALAIYFTGFLQGASFSLIPAMGSILHHAPYHMSHTDYGLLYAPEIIGALLSALLVGSLQKRWGAKNILNLGIGLNALAMALMGIVVLVPSLAFWLLLLEVSCLGVGFVLTNAAINRTSALIFTGATTTAITLLNAVIVAATALSPIVLIIFHATIGWAFWPGLLLLLWLVALFLPRAHESGEKEIGGLNAWRPSMIPFALAVIIYATLEGTFSSWANAMTGLHKGNSLLDGEIVLALFWAGMGVGRLVLGAIPDHIVPHRWMYRVAPVAMAACLIAIPYLTDSFIALVISYAIAGAACAVYYPFSMAYGLDHEKQAATQMAGLLVAALMLGEGIGSFVLGPLQNWLPLGTLYQLFALLTLPLIYLAWRNTRPAPSHATTGFKP